MQHIISHISDLFEYSITNTRDNVVPQYDYSIVQGFRHMQRGLVGNYDFTNIVTLSEIPENIKYEKLLGELGPFYFKFNDVRINKKLDYSVVIAFSIDFWNKISGDKLQKPTEDCFRSVYKNNIQVLFQVKARNQQLLNSTTQELLKQITKLNFTYKVTKCFKNGQNLILAGRFKDNVEVSKDPYTFYLHSLIGYQDAKHIGGSYLMAQKSRFNWNNLHLQNQNLSLMIGRRQMSKGENQIFSQNFSKNSHVKRSRVKDQFGNPIIMGRQSKLFTQIQPKREITDPQKPQEGNFFFGFSNHVKKIQKIILNQLGTKDSPIIDPLIYNITVQIGGILFIPSATNLGYHLSRKQNIHNDINQLSQLNSIDWIKDFSGFKDRSASPYLFYSRNTFLQNMSLFKKQKNSFDIEPPSPRILRMISKTFTLWGDTWYYNRKQPQLKHLAEYLQQYKQDPNLTKYSNSDFNKLSIYIRSGLSHYISLGHVFTSKQYGCRGQNNKGAFGANTYHVQPEDILVGGVSHLNLGQGKYIINYLTEDEAKQNYINGSTISPESGIGHVSPHYDQIMQIGLGGLINKYSTKILQYSLKKEQMIKQIKQLSNYIGNDNKISHKKSLVDSLTIKIDFFLSSKLAILGLQKYYHNYRKLTLEKISKLSSSQVYQIKNLQQVAQRLKNLQTQPPKTFQEGAQIILTLFASMHLTGEPISLGRIDQALIRFIQDQNLLTKQQIIKYQDTIDNLFIKIGQKVNYDRNTFEYYQKDGPSAGTYRKGAILDQSGQQVTIGGTTKCGKPLYNIITLLALKSARRLPLNAPTLGLRVRSDIPDLYIREATKSVLSGGAHPILLNDDKIIPGIINSGKIHITQDIWNSEKSVDVPYSRWNPHVSLEDARNYTSDGSYEIIIQGKTSLSLTIGGCLLEPLQYLINQGKNLLDTGFRFIHVKTNFLLRTSINSLVTYEKFEKQYFRYFKIIYAKEFAENLKRFGESTSICPAPLLNIFTEYTFDRQLDFYSNGSQYNLYAPKFIGFSNWINAMWNIKQLVYIKQQTTLDEVRMALMNNWGQNLTEPSCPFNIPQISKIRLKTRFQQLRKKVWQQDKFGFQQQISEFGAKLTKKISETIFQVFNNPQPAILKLIKDLTKRFSNEKTTFGIQIIPGCGTFSRYLSGMNQHPSFDGRKRFDPIAQYYNRQSCFYDLQEIDTQNSPIQLTLSLVQSPDLITGTVLDLNIDEDYPLQLLVNDIKLFTLGLGPTIITITTCDINNMQSCITNTDLDLLRFKTGGLQQYGIRMLPKFFRQHLRRPRSVWKLTQKMKEKLNKLRQKRLKKK